MKVTLNLNSDMIATLERVAQALEIRAPDQRVRLAAAIQALADNWEAGQPDEPEPAGEVERKSRTSRVVDEALLSQITSPDITLDLKTQHQQTTPRAADGLVPWEYILAGYRNLDFVNIAVDGTDAQIELVREVLTKVPEDKWETEQVRSVIARAFERLR